MGWPVLEALNIFKPIAEGIISGRKHKRDLKHAVRMQKIKNVENGRVAEVQWNEKAMEKRSWITGWFVILLSIPLIGAFMPPMVTHINAGFTALEAMPLWYQAGVGSALALAFAAKQLQNIPFAAKMNKAYTLPKEK